MTAVMLLAAVPGQAATYYVAADGSDSSTSPTNPATPWQSVSKVNATLFNPGDQILFRRGDTWSGAIGGTLVPGSSGAPGLPIVYGAYGSGAKPVFNGTGLPGAGMAFSNKSHLQIQDLAFRINANQGIQVLFCNHVTIRGVEVSDNQSGPGIVARGGSHIHIDNCTVINARSNGILFNGSELDKIRDSIIENCTVTGTRANDGIVIHMQQILDQNGQVIAWHQAGENFIIRNNVSSNSHEQGYDITTGTNVLLENNRSFNNRAGGIVIGHTARNVTVRYHESSNEPAANTASTLKISITDALVEYSTFVGSPHNKPVVLIDNSMHDWAPKPENITLRNNVFVWDHSASGNLFNMNPAVETQHLTMYNNIFISRSANQAVMRFGNPARPPSHPTYMIDHNLYHAPNGLRWSVGSTSGITFPTYQGTYGRDTNGLSASPLFANLSIADFRLQAGSPAIDTGLNLGLAVDFAGNPVPQGAGRDIGAFEGAVEGAAPPAAPTSLAATAVSGAQVDLFWVDNATDETAFLIQRRVGAEPYGFLATRGANATTHSDTTVYHATTYTYRVQAQNADGASPWSNEATATTPVNTTLPIVYDNPELRIIEVVTPRSPAYATLSVNNAVGGTVLRFNFRDLSVPNHAIVGLDVPTTQMYRINLRIRRDQWQGIHQLSIDGIDQGSPFDGWVSSGGNFLNVNLGTRHLSAGERQFKFTLVGANPGKDPGNLDFQLMIDTITLTPIDTTAPVLTLPFAITTEATGPTGAAVIYSATAHDDFDGDVPVTTSHPSGSTFPLGTTQVTASATDAAGNSANGGFTVTVVDTTPPEIAVPENIEIEATTPAGAAVNYTASAFDLVGGALPVTPSHPSGSIFPLGETTVTLAAIDPAGNIAMESFTITVVDTTAPVIHSLVAAPNHLWPVDGRMVPVAITAVVSDQADPAPVTRIIAISSNEPVNAAGAGSAGVDWEQTGPMALALRAARSALGSGRVYTLTVKSTDASGNATYATTEVLVPHDERR